MNERRKKSRIDQLVVERGLADTRSKAQAMIMAGEIIVNGEIVRKSGHTVPCTVEIDLKSKGPKYVSRGGIKLAGALDHFRIDPKQWICLDVGASTGGFTDCLLQRGAVQVCTLDVGKGQLDPKIRNDSRVMWKESFHAKDLKPETFGKSFDLAVVDVSFISLMKVLPFVVQCLKPEGILLALIKPQFEATRKDVIKGVLRDEGKRRDVLGRMRSFVSEKLGLRDVSAADSVLPGPKGNREAFLFGRLGKSAPPLK